MQLEDRAREPSVERNGRREMKFRCARRRRKDTDASEDARIARFSTVSLTYVIRCQNSEHAPKPATVDGTIKSEKRGAFYFSPRVYIACCPYAELRESSKKIPFTGDVPREWNRAPELDADIRVSAVRARDRHTGQPDPLAVRARAYVRHVSSTFSARRGGWDGEGKRG